MRLCVLADACALERVTFFWIVKSGRVSLCVGVGGSPVFVCGSLFACMFVCVRRECT